MKTDWVNVATISGGKLARMFMVQVHVSEAFVEDVSEFDILEFLTEAGLAHIKQFVSKHNGGFDS